MREAGAEGKALPFQFPVLAAHVLGLPPLLSGRFRPELPVFGALGVNEGQLEWALALRVQSGAEVVAELSTGSEARFQRVSSEGVTLLRGASRTFGVVDSYIVLASSESAVIRYAPFLVRAVPTTFDPAADADAVLQVEPLVGQRLDALLDRLVAVTSQRVESALLAEVAARGKGPDRVDAAELFGIARDLTGAIRSGIHSVAEGTLEFRLSPDELALHGQLAFDGGVRRGAGPKDRAGPVTTGSEPSSAALPSSECARVLKLDRDVLVAAVLPRAMFGRQNVLRLATALGVASERATDELGPLVDALRGPVVLGIAQHQAQPHWWMQAELAADPKAVQAPFALLDAPLVRSWSAARTFPSRVTAGAKGFIVSTGAEPPWQFAWRNDAGLSRWALGVHGSDWLARGDTAEGSLRWASWGALCQREPLAAFGWVHPGGSIEFAMATAHDSLYVRARAPTPVLVSWMAAGGSRR
jgi:hypothetical protein